ncbi:MAG: MBL fold metallo-hydrolase [Candidatus Rokuibacteriota bacterium]
MKITLLGTGNPAPSLSRMSPGYMVRVGEDLIVLDHGPGSHHRLLQTGARAVDVTHAFFTHLHYDHFLDLPRLVLTRWDHGAGQVPELKVYGPRPIRRLVDRLIGPDGAFGPDIEARTKWDASLYVYRNRGGVEPRRPPAPEVTEIGKGDTVETARWRVQAIEVPHAQPHLTCLGLRLDCDEGSVVYTGDTGPSKAVEKLAEGCDVLIHMCSHISGSVDDPATRAGTSGHLDAARAAAAAGARCLVASHVYDQFDRPGVRERVIAEMARIYDGVIVLGEDLMELTADPRKPGIYR